MSDPSNLPPQTAKYHGLVNQGATCYLNSVLQVLFMTEDFKSAVERFVEVELCTLKQFKFMNIQPFIHPS